MKGEHTCTRMVVVRCSEAELQRIDKVARATRHHRSTVVQEAIAQFCEELEAPRPEDGNNTADASCNILNLYPLKQKATRHPKNKADKA